MADQMVRKSIPAESGGSLSPRARSALQIIKWAARAFVLIIVVQLFLAGLALFVDTGNWAAHANFARVFVILPVLMILVSFIARLPAAFRVKSIQLLVMVVLMFVTADLSSRIGYLSALHPVIAAGMFWVAISQAQHAAASVKG